MTDIVQGVPKPYNNFPLVLFKDINPLQSNTAEFKRQIVKQLTETDGSVFISKPDTDG